MHNGTGLSFLFISLWYHSCQRTNQRIFCFGPCLCFNFCFWSCSHHFAIAHLPAVESTSWLQVALAMSCYAVLRASSILKSSAVLSQICCFCMPAGLSPHGQFYQHPQDDWCWQCVETPLSGIMSRIRASSSRRSWQAGDTLTLQHCKSGSDTVSWQWDQRFIVPVIVCISIPRWFLWRWLALWLLSSWYSENFWATILHESWSTSLWNFAWAAAMSHAWGCNEACMMVIRDAVSPAGSFWMT